MTTLEVRQDGIYTNGIKCEDQEMALSLINKLPNVGFLSCCRGAHTLHSTCSLRGNTYSIPNLRWEVKTRCQTCGVPDDSDCGIYKMEECDFVSEEVARLILEEQEPDKESQLSLWLEVFRATKKGSPSEIIEKWENNYVITRKPPMDIAP